MCGMPGMNARDGEDTLCRFGRNGRVRYQTSLQHEVGLL